MAFVHRTLSFLIEVLTTSLILISSRIVTEEPHQGSVNKLLYCIVQLQYKTFEICIPKIVQPIGPRNRRLFRKPLM